MAAVYFFFGFYFVVATGFLVQQHLEIRGLRRSLEKSRTDLALLEDRAQQEYCQAQDEIHDLQQETRRYRELRREVERIACSSFAGQSARTALLQSLENIGRL